MARIEELGLSLIRKCQPCLVDGSANLLIQDESKRRIFPQRSPEDGHIDWERTAERIQAFVRAQPNPVPGGFSHWNENKVTIWPTEKHEGISESPGALVVKSRYLQVGAADGWIQIDRIEIEGKEFVGRAIPEVINSGKFV